MKKVRHVFGAVGVAPLAVGMMLPAAGPAQASPAKAKGKTVSLDHGVAPDRFGCSGTHEASKVKSSLFMYYFFTVSSAGSNTCVGTVFGQHSGGFPDWNMRVSVSYEFGTTATKRCAQSGKNPCFVAFHSWFPGLRHVCTSWYNPAGTLKAKTCRDPVAKS